MLKNLFCAITFIFGGYAWATSAPTVATIAYQIAAYDRAYAGCPGYSPSSKSTELVDIAFQGIAYVREHYEGNEDVQRRCDRLGVELTEKRSEGLTAEEFVRFNLKLALCQGLYPNGYPPDLYPEIREILETEQWLTIPFWELEYNTYGPLSREQLGSPPSFISLSTAPYKIPLKPYIIYAPDGKIDHTIRLSQLLREDDGTSRNLMVLAARHIPLAHVPNSFYNRAPYSLLSYEMSQGVEARRTLESKTNQLFLSKLKASVDIKNPLVQAFLFLWIHEGRLWLEDSSKFLDRTSGVSVFLENIVRNIRKISSERLSYLPRKKNLKDPFGDVFKQILKPKIGFPEVTFGYLTERESGDVLHGFAEFYLKVKDCERVFSIPFLYQIKRTGESLPGDDLYEMAEVLYIELWEKSGDEGPYLGPRSAYGELPKKIRDTSGKRFPVPKAETKNIEFDQQIKIALRALYDERKAEEEFAAIPFDKKEIKFFEAILSLLEQIQKMVPPGV